MTRVVGLAVLAAFLGSCMETHSCTEIGCSDQAGVTIATASGEWEPGDYALNIAFDASTSSCDFNMPDDLPAGVGQWGKFECHPQLDVYFVPRVTCTEREEGGSSSQTCTPIPNQFDLEVSRPGTPSTVSVELGLGGLPLLDEAHPLQYQELRPNGPECGPVCRQANVKIAIP